MIVPVEAMAHGTPVVALAQGGVVESVVDGKTGVLFREPTLASLVGAIQKLNKQYNDYNDYNNYKRVAEKFGKERFQRELMGLRDVCIRLGKAPEENAYRFDTGCTM